MTSSLPFVPNAEKIIAALQGDIGIAKKLHEASIAPILAGIKDRNTLAKFKKNSAPPKKSGFASFERTTISTMMENFKPLIELALVVLDLLSGVEVFLGKSFTGINPYAIADSFSSGKLLATQALAGIKKAGLAAGSGKDVPKPAAVLFGVWSDKGRPLMPTKDELKGRLYDKPWQFIRSKEEHKQQRLDGLKETLARMKEPDKSNFLRANLESIEKEWDAMSTEGVMFIKRRYYGVLETPVILPIRGYLEAATYDDPRGEVSFDPENDYNITVTYKDRRHVVSGVLREESGGLPLGQTGNGPRTPSKSPYVPIPLKAPLLLVQLILPIITKRLMPAISTLMDILADPSTFLLTLVMSKLKEHFEWFDPSIAKAVAKGKAKLKRASAVGGKAKNGKAKGTLLEKDPNSIASKYVVDGKFLLDGAASVSLLGFTLTVGLKDAVPFVRTTPMEPGEKEQPTLKMIMNMVKMPIAFIEKIVKKFMELIQKLVNPTKVASAIAEFLTFKWLTDIVSPASVMEMLGIKTGMPGGEPLIDSGESKAAELFKKVVAKADEAKKKLDKAKADSEKALADATSKAGELAASAAAPILAALAKAQEAADKARTEVEAAVAKKLKAAADKAKHALEQATAKAAQVFAVTKQFLVMIQEFLNSLVAMPLDIFNLPKSVRDAIPKIQLV